MDKKLKTKDEIFEQTIMKNIRRKSKYIDKVQMYDSQYAGNDFKALLAQHEITGSMSKKGDCWDNAVAQSFFHTLK